MCLSLLASVYAQPCLRCAIWTFASDTGLSQSSHVPPNLSDGGAMPVPSFEFTNAFQRRAAKLEGSQVACAWAALVRHRVVTTPDVL